MKIAIAQLNYHIGNFNSNTEKIISSIKNARKDGADIIIFSELSVCGYSPLDMLEHKDFITKSDMAVDKIRENSANIAVIIGAPTLNPNPKGKNLHNSAIFINNKKIIKTIHKTLLPTYDIFDEYRYFEPNEKFEIIEFQNHKIAITICEDLWDEQKSFGFFNKETLYKTSPLEHLIKLNPDLVVNISGSPYSYNQVSNRKEILVKNAQKHSIPIIYVNQIGANTDLIFDGGSLAIDNKGETVLECDYFKEDYKIFSDELLNKSTKIISTQRDKFSDIYNALVLGVKDYFEKLGFTKTVIGLSGGIDSALTLAIAVAALGNKNVVALLMPSKYSSEHSIADAVDMAKRCKVKYHIINIEKLRIEFGGTMHNLFDGTKEGITEENIQARLRGSILMAYSNKFGNMVLNTSNKSEAAVGYSTLYGDMNGAISVLGDVYKTDIYKLCDYINNNIADIIPQNTITKPPSAELRPDQKDNDSLP